MPRYLKESSKDLCQGVAFQLFGGNRRGSAIQSGYKLTASQVVRRIGLLPVFASQNVHNVRDDMAEFVVLLRKKIKDSLTKQGHSADV